MDLISRSGIEKHKKVCATLNYNDQLLVSVSAIISCVSISAFVLLVWILVSIAIFATRS